MIRIYQICRGDLVLCKISFQAEAQGLCFPKRNQKTQHEATLQGLCGYGVGYLMADALQMLINTQ